jgi:hypothetical protein
MKDYSHEIAVNKSGRTRPITVHKTVYYVGSHRKMGPLEYSDAGVGIPYVYDAYNIHNNLHMSRDSWKKKFLHKFLCYGRIRRYDENGHEYFLVHDDDYVFIEFAKTYPANKYGLYRELCDKEDSEEVRTLIIATMVAENLLEDNVKN